MADSKFFHWYLTKKLKKTRSLSVSKPERAKTDEEEIPQNDNVDEKEGNSQQDKVPQSINQDDHTVEDPAAQEEIAKPDDIDIDNIDPKPSI